MAKKPSKNIDLQKELLSAKRKSKEFASLIKVSELVNSTRQLDELLELVMDVIKKVIEVEASSLLLLDAATGNISYRIALGEKGGLVKEKVRLKLGQGIGGWVVQTGQPLIVDDVRKDKRFYSDVDRVTGFKTRSILCVPLIVRGRHNIHSILMVGSIKIHPIILMFGYCGPLCVPNIGH